MLYQDGILASRDRLAWVSDMIWDDGDLRPRTGSHRRWSEEQVQVLRCVLSLVDHHGLRIEAVAAAIGSMGLHAGLKDLVAEQERKLEQTRAAVEALPETASIPRLPNGQVSVRAELSA